jgi:hypothetical protein
MMAIRGVFKWVICAALAAIPRIARAADPAAAQPAPDRMRIAVMFVPAPLGVLESGPGTASSVGAEPAYGMMTTFDFLARHNLFAGFAPAYAFHVRARGAPPSASPGRKFDLLFRFGYSHAIGERVRAYGYFAPGYSFLSQLNLGVESQGPLIGVHAGGQYGVTEAFFLAAEIGYQAGFQRSQYDLEHIAFSTNYIQIGVGAGTQF